ncbi:phage holin family protein [Adhaeribacter swui]|uniref:Phage holin family protein n=1 Tax=Adhaeribacter swui TaxID=2086471 RepID=A0A7G7GBP5_9BACT|nr:phage holin family protein [Adhaeribacter swui]QNF34579.1 phage holin family protein [Adhaeribacter swui]
MGFIIKLILTGVAALVASYILPGVTIDGLGTAILLAIVLGILNAIVKPILVVLSLPITIVTLGLFLLVINAVIILIADYLLSGFSVNGFFWALIFSFVLSILTSIVDMITK